MPPNTRMQRTRSSASPPRSPLMRNPLGRLMRRYAYATLLASGLTACASSAPTSVTATMGHPADLVGVLTVCVNGAGGEYDAEAKAALVSELRKAGIAIDAACVPSARYVTITVSVNEGTYSPVEGEVMGRYHVTADVRRMVDGDLVSEAWVQRTDGAHLRTELREVSRALVNLLKKGTVPKRGPGISTGGLILASPSKAA